MKVRTSAFSNNYVDLTPEELVDKIIKDEDGYFLDYEDNEMMEEFCQIACSLVDNDEEIDSRIDEFKMLLVDARDRINEMNYNDFVKDSVDFIKAAWAEDFADESYSPVFGEAKARGFADSIAILYHEFCNEKIE